MLHDQALIDKLSRLPTTLFEGNIFRATPKNVKPLAASISGGRWAPGSDEEDGCTILYTSLDKNGAIAELAYYLALLDPAPSKPFVVHELAVTTRKTLKLVCTDLEDLSVEGERYKTRDYRQTQKIGAVANFLGCDGLIAPSARWDCQNLMLFPINLGDSLTAIGSEEIDWINWSIRMGILPKGDTK